MNSRKQILVAIVLILSYFCFLLLLDPRDNFICRGDSCPKEVINDLRDKRANLNQSAFVEIQDITVGKSIKNSEQNGKQIIIEISEDNTIIVKIPYKNSPGTFNYVTPHGTTVEDIGIQIFHSKTFNITLNKDIAYTHYYPIAEFEFNHSQPLYLDPKLTYKKLKIETVIFIHDGSQIVYLIAAIVTWLALMFSWKSIARRSVRKENL